MVFTADQHGIYSRSESSNDGEGNDSKAANFIKYVYDIQLFLCDVYNIYCRINDTEWIQYISNVCSQRSYGEDMRRV